ncbi:uncharacterized protein LOC104902448 [Beta vulgaris subsp. vulgaris]|uniref:uncharacterized protein LOC104902448 n=1 Tax=Beta vulgaris subsp. vulgaris TaxID=3555 RepID=UPI002036F4FE|nr:uncharacterized protein LOC104902448 [Beta vulgaris subsp. vulgaris]
MGNTSCFPAIISSNSATKVLRWDGGLRVYPRPVKAAELMLENPGHFVCSAGTLQVGHRISGLVANDELQPRTLYFLLPMDLLYSVITTDEVSHMDIKAHKAAKQGNLHNLGKIFPIFSEFCMFPLEQKRSESDSKASITEPDTSIRLLSQTSWRPALETIVEAS